MSTEKKKIYDKIYREKNKEKYKQYHKKWYQDNKERYRERHITYWKEYYPKNIKRISKYNKELYQKIKDLRREWRRKNRVWINERQKERRHKLGINKTYRGVLRGTFLPKKYYRKRRKYMEKNAGDLTIQTIQKVYEDNIKQYGTLTCYLCLLPIGFGWDSLEHKNPLCRGGTNAYENLAVAHLGCNIKKSRKTEEEYRRILNV